MVGRFGLIRYGVHMVGALVVRPWLVATALRQVTVMAPSRWWTRSPYLPLPPGEYLEFRQVTATGNGDGALGVHDTVIWLEWCRSMHRLPPR